MTHSPATLEAIYREWGPAVRSFLRRGVASTDAADELLQETFLVVARDPGPLLAATSKRAWLIGIAANLLRTHRRRDVRNRTMALTPDLAARSGNASDSRTDVMRAAIGKLPKSHQIVLELRLVDELSYAEIGEALELPIGTVRSRIHNAVVRLRDALSSDAGWMAEEHLRKETGNVAR